MAFTVAPISPIFLSPGTSIRFGSDLVVCDTPDWLKTQPMLVEIGTSNRESVRRTPHAFVAEYEARAIDEPDPSWKAEEPRSIQDTKSEAISMANLALWLVKPTPLCFRLVLHAICPFPMPADCSPRVLRVDTATPLYHHLDDKEKRLSHEDVMAAAKLYSVLSFNPAQQCCENSHARILGGTDVLCRRHPLFALLDRPRGTLRAATVSGRDNA